MSYDRVAVAKRDLERTRQLIERQRQAISRLRELGQPTDKSEKVLAVLERNEVIFENCHLAALNDGIGLRDRDQETGRGDKAPTPLSQPVAPYLGDAHPITPDLDSERALLHKVGSEVVASRIESPSDEFHGCPPPR